jgi:LCP family protein required for cell wall assembly
VLLLGAGLAAGGLRGQLGFWLRDEVILGLLALNVGLAVYHVAAIADAWLVAERQAGYPTRSVGARLVVVLLVVATLGLHGVVEAIGYQAYGTLRSIFGPPGPDGDWAIPAASLQPSPSPSPSASPSPSPSPSPRGPRSLLPAPSAIPSPSPRPSPTPPPAWAADGRLDLLLIGSDAGPDRWSLRTDTMIVLSVEVATGRATLFGIPRNLVGVPLPAESAGAFTDGRFPRLLNALYVYASGHPGSFPGGEARGFRAVTGAIQELVGVALDGAVVVDLAGFVRLVDAIGGLWIDVPERVIDANYPEADGSGYLRIDIRMGCQKLDGRMALAYARSRHQDSDYGRMRRQQAVLVAIARQVDPLALLPQVPELLEIAGRHLWTTIDRADIGSLASLAARVDTSRVTTVRFVPPRYPAHLTLSEIDAIRAVVRGAFAEPAPTSSPTVDLPSCP